LTISINFSLTFHISRYEVESDENRKNCVLKIGRRYLGIDDIEFKDHEENNEKTELNNLSQNNVSSPKNNQVSEKSEGQSLTENDLVIDILNDEDISQVRQKIQGK
jgi:hypothetical protein